MIRFLVAACVLAACSAPAPLARPSEPVAAAATPAPTTTATTPPPTTAPAATPEPSPTEAATPEPTEPPAPPAPPLPDGPVHNEGQWIVVWYPSGIGFHIGEAPVAGTFIGNYRLNGVPLTTSTLRCAVKTTGETCTDLRILPSTPLVFGRRYELALLDWVIGSFTAVGPATLPTPHAVSVEAAQHEVTVTFDRPMAHVYDCGGTANNLGAAHTIGFVREFASGFPFQPGAYTSSDPAYEAWFTSFVSEAPVSDDCRSVTFSSTWGAPSGTFALTVSGIADEYGTLMAPRTFEVTIEDEGAAPQLMFTQVESQTLEEKVIRVAYSEAMDEEYVTDRERYFLNGTPLPAGTQLECVVASCTWVRLTFAPSAFGYGSTNTLTIVGVRDSAGNVMQPDIVTSGTFRVY